MWESQKPKKNSKKERPRPGFEPVSSCHVGEVAEDLEKSKRAKEQKN